MMNEKTDYREQIEQSIHAELCDAGFFSQIANEAPSKEHREIIKNMVGEEYGHAQIQATLLHITTPSMHYPPEGSAATGRFEADVESAVKCGLEAIQRYTRLREHVPDSDIRRRLASILDDEYAHIRIWTSLLCRMDKN